jgi:lysophospholipase L1-like esterase
MRRFDGYDIFGGLIVIAALTFNEFFIKLILKCGNHFNSIIKSGFLIAVELVFVWVGIFIIKQKRQALSKLGLVALGIFIALFCGEIILSSGVFDSLLSEKPLWIPAKYKEIDHKQNLLHSENSKINKYGFNDVEHTFTKNTDTILRIAILGDSFIWGDGVPDSAIWTRKLQRRFETTKLSCEILNWGKGGWSTLDEFTFLKTEGKRFQFDYLIFAFVVNDPIMDSSSPSPREFITRNGLAQRSILRVVSFIFPNVVSFATDITNNFFFTYFDYGPLKWNQKVYSSENLAKYDSLLGQIKSFCDSIHVKFSFVLTPENHNTMLESYFEKIIPILNKHSISYLDLYPFVKSELGHFPNRKLWANPANGHPGSMVTDVYAKYVFRYLNDELPNQALKLTE